MPKRADGDIKWLIVYVMLSRVRSLSRLRSIGLSSNIRKIIEGGPPEEIAKALKQLCADKIESNKVACAKTREAMGWPARK